MAPTLIRSLSVSLGLVVAFSATDEQKDFSGTWKMDSARSESAHQAVPIGPITLLIKQTATEITIETTTNAGGNVPASIESFTYKLDGSENTITNASGAPIKTVARWDGPKLITETLRTINGTPVTLRHVLTLGPNGKQLTIDKTLTVQHGYQSPGGNNVGRGKDVFVRMSGSSRK